MKNIKEFLAMVFQDISVYSILGKKEKIRYNQLDDSIVMKLMERRQNYYSRNELRAQLAYFQDVCEEYNKKWALGDEENTQLDIFSLMFYYVSLFLTVQRDMVCCQYSHLLHWRMMTLELGEDMLVCAFLAQNDAVNNIKRTIFDWPIVIGHNNTELNMILSQGMAENHFHLKGSAPFFHLSWCHFMNNRLTYEDSGKFDEINTTSRKISYSVSSSYDEVSLENQIIQAAAIRAYLFQKLIKIPDGEYEKQLIDFLCANNFSEKIVSKREEIYGWINGLRVTMMSKENYSLSDYAVMERREKGGYTICNTDNAHPTNVEIYRGERHFMYLAFLDICLNLTLTSWEKNLFFAYLVIKERFRRELLQINYDNVGFENFSIIENRKSFFVSGDILAKEAMQETLFYPGIKFLEVRIVPANSVQDNVELIKRMDDCIDYNEKNRKKFSYIFHFIKRVDDSIRKENQNVGIFLCRHDALRRELSQQANAIIELREQYPHIGARVVGIDAANQEIGCRPEVFASVFRQLKKHTVRGISDKVNFNVPQIKLTYHVGEDFLDPLDGLRAIDEAIHFLQMGCGDRLGHALALGIDIEKWYKQKTKILLPCQDYLDNIVWLYFALSDYNIDGMDNLKTHLEDEFHTLFNKIYRPYIHKEMLDQIVKKANEFYLKKENIVYYNGAEYKFDIYHYYKSCLLRGDDPEYYIEGFFKDLDINTYRKNPHKINWDFPEKFNTRMIPEVSMLYYYYHFDVNVKKTGSIYMSKKPHPDYIKAVKLVQKKMQNKIASLGICIETNPTSNYLIGTFKRYDEHPIIKWYNHSLESDSQKINESPQLSVSINTDDMGVFSTKLDNEFSLMALALELKKDENGKCIYDKSTVYNWIDDIRKFGLRQSFINQNQELYPEEGEIIMEIDREVAKNKSIKVNDYF